MPINYEPINYQNAPSTATPRNAYNLNKTDQAAKQACDGVDAINADLASKILPIYGNTLAVGTDFNTLKSAAIYDYQGNLSYINAPASGEYGILEVVKLNIFILQRATNVVANTIKHRTSYDNGVSWTTWA
jgi:hypothetical protein